MTEAYLPYPAIFNMFKRNSIPAVIFIFGVFFIEGRLQAKVFETNVEYTICFRTTFDGSASIFLFNRQG